MTRRLTKCKGHTNREMNNATYLLRRSVMQYIYEAKHLLGGNMPRVSVRITDAHDSNVLGEAYMRGNSIFISANTVVRPDLRVIVFHELCHAVFGTKHVSECLLMSPTVKKISHDDTTRLFLKYANVLT